MSTQGSPLVLPAVFSYGLFGLPLAMLALPIYIYVGAVLYAAQQPGSGHRGAVLLAARIAAAFIDPALGAWIARGTRSYAACIALALPLLLLGFGALFHPPALPEGATLAWFLTSLLLVYAAYGLASIAPELACGAEPGAGAAFKSDGRCAKAVAWWVPARRRASLPYLGMRACRWCLLSACSLAAAFC